MSVFSEPMPLEPPMVYCDSLDDCDLYEAYYGWQCRKCDMFIPYGSEPWMPLDDDLEWFASEDEE